MRRPCFLVGVALLVIGCQFYAEPAADGGRVWQALGLAPFDYEEEYWIVDPLLEDRTASAWDRDWNHCRSGQVVGWRLHVEGFKTCMILRGWVPKDPRLRPFRLVPKAGRDARAFSEDIAQCQRPISASGENSKSISQVVRRCMQLKSWTANRFPDSPLRTGCGGLPNARIGDDLGEYPVVGACGVAR